ncbi:MAG TPA: NAD(+) synthase [Clostridiales bacterium]|nr:NAD(+) synthase [Clostridiales bacterium]
MGSIRVALAQINPTVGDLEGNCRLILDYVERARDAGADLVAFPELALTGYPPEDLLLKPKFVRDNLEYLRRIAGCVRGLAAVVGFVDAADDLYNAAAVLYDGEVAGVYRKVHLPNYGVFDEDRYFRPGREQPLFVIAGVTVGVSVCEDIWYPTGPPAVQARAGAKVLLNINASPFHAGKRQQRERMLATRAFDYEVIVCYLNAVGGQDELVFDGASVVVDQGGRVLARGRQFEEDLVVVDLDVDAVFRSRLHDPRGRRDPLYALPDGVSTPVTVVSTRPAARDRPPLDVQTARAGSSPSGPLLEGEAEIYAALVLGTRDYVRKNGYEKVVIGLSGGIDSSLVAAIAADALGPENVLGISMPSRYSSRGSVEDAEELCRRLGIRLVSVPIEPAFQAYLDMLAGPFAACGPGVDEAARGAGPAEPEAAGATRGAGLAEPGVAEENIQARIRGNILMAFCNKFHFLALTAGNKSEVATGYATLYGADTTGALSPIKDVPKTMVYRLAEYRNRRSPVIPETVLAKEPSAELRPGQKDTDTLPPYPLLDPILQAYVEEDRSVEEIVAMGFPEDVVRRVAAMVERSEYKRRQSPPGIKVTPRAFGRDRRLPITNRYRQ